MTELHPAPESLFWYWIAERHAIYLRRKAGQSKPWTTDPILQTYKFTNPFRENDKGTVWLREHFLEPHRQAKHTGDCAIICEIDWDFKVEERDCTCDEYAHNLSLLAFNICWYRAFNWTGTGKLLGWQTEWRPEFIKELLRIELRNGRQVFTGAHIIRSEFNRPKIDSIVDVCSDLYHMCVAAGALVTSCREERRLENVFHTLKTVPYIGPFQAYEMVTDMRHTRLLEDAIDIMTWANAGPGALRGLERLQLPHRTQDEACESMRGLLGRSGSWPSATSWPGEPVQLQDGRAKEWTCSGCGGDLMFCKCKWPQLEMRDIEHSLCEFDKYCRSKFGEGKPRSRYPGV